MIKAAGRPDSGHTASLCEILPSNHWRRRNSYQGVLLIPFLSPPQEAWSGNVGTALGLVWNALAPEFPSHPLLSLGTLSLSRGQVNSGQPSMLPPQRSPFCFSKPGKDSSFSGVYPSLSWDNKHLVYQMGGKAREKRRCWGQKPPVNTAKQPPDIGAVDESQGKQGFGGNRWIQNCLMPLVDK